MITVCRSFFVLIAEDFRAGRGELSCYGKLTASWHENHPQHDNSPSNRRELSVLSDWRPMGTALGPESCAWLESAYA